MDQTPHVTGLLGPHPGFKPEEETWGRAAGSYALAAGAKLKLATWAFSVGAHQMQEVL